jgi:TonB family protein
MRKNKQRPWLWAVLFALLLHLIGLSYLLPFLTFSSTNNLNGFPNDDKILVDLWNDKDVKTPEEILESYKPNEEIPKGQVVQVPTLGESRPPDKDAKYLSERDNRVETETQASLRIYGPATVAPSPSLQGTGKSTLNIRGDNAQNLTSVGPPSPNLERADEGEFKASRLDESELKGLSLTPSESAMQSVLAGTGLDHLEGVVEGDNTALNTKGFEFASFFNRVKSMVERYWHPDIEFQNRDPYGNIYGHKDRTTVLLVVLRPDGELKKAYVMEPCGASFLDDEAKEAVEKAAPFPNVPAGLMDKNDGLVKFTFYFTVEVGEAPILRMRRY